MSAGDALAIEALRQAAEGFHKILASIHADAAIERYANGGPPYPRRDSVLVDSLRAKLLTEDQVEELAAEMFERCVRALHALGADDVTIIECKEGDIG